MRIYGYLRASTDEQNALRAKKIIEDFLSDNNVTASAWFVENESGASLKRPELFRLIDIAESGDILIVEQVDRISRLNASDWHALKTTIQAKGIRVVALDLPSSFQMLESTQGEFMARMLTAINDMMLDMLAAVARKDYEDRRRRQKEGIETAKRNGKYKGRKRNKALWSQIEELLKLNKSNSEIATFLHCSKTTVSKVRQEMNCKGDAC